MWTLTGDGLQELRSRPRGKEGDDAEAEQQQEEGGEVHYFTLAGSSRVSF